MKLKICEDYDFYKCNRCKNSFMAPIDDIKCPICGAVDDYEEIHVSSDYPYGFEDRNSVDHSVKRKSMQSSEIMKKYPREAYYYVIPLERYGFRKEIKYLKIVNGKRFADNLKYAILFNSFNSAEKYIETAQRDVPDYAYCEPVKVLLTYNYDRNDNLTYEISLCDK